MVSGGIKNEKFPQAIEIILKELKKIRKYPPSKAELRRAKEFYTGQMLMALEDTADHMLWIGEQMVSLDEIFTSADILKEIGRVAPQDICRVADRFFRSGELNLAAIGPIRDEDRKQIDKILETLE